MVRIHFNGLKTEDYIHPDEQLAKEKVEQSDFFKKSLQYISDVQIKWNASVIQGSYVQLTAKTAPRVIDILEETCKILDCATVPDLYLYHSFSQAVQPYGSGHPYLLVADYVVDNFDDGMLFYLFGNAISMILAGHVPMTTIAAYMGFNMLTAIPQMEFKRFLHLADMTSDRGGLLACQSIASAAKCHFLELGFPLKETNLLFYNDIAAERYIEKYLKEVHLDESGLNLMNRVAQKVIDANYMEGAANVMLNDLYWWYQSGYQTLLRRFGGRGRT